MDGDERRRTETDGDGGRRAEADGDGYYKKWDIELSYSQHVKSRPRKRPRKWQVMVIILFLLRSVALCCKRKVVFCG